MNDRSLYVKREAARALSKLGPPADAALREALASENGEVRHLVEQLQKDTDVVGQDTDLETAGSRGVPDGALETAGLVVKGLEPGLGIAAGEQVVHR